MLNRITFVRYNYECLFDYVGVVDFVDSTEYLHNSCVIEYQKLIKCVSVTLGFREHGIKRIKIKWSSMIVLKLLYLD